MLQKLLASMVEDYKLAARYRQWYLDTLATKSCTQTTTEADNIKRKCAYWESWTGSRWVREENPDIDSVSDTSSVCRSCPITGKWSIL
jgi:hypothetical protein